MYFQAEDHFKVLPAVLSRKFTDLALIGAFTTVYQQMDKGVPRCLRPAFTHLCQGLIFLAGSLVHSIHGGLICVAFQDAKNIPADDIYLHLFDQDSFSSS